MALHLLQGGLGGETLFILEYVHAGGGERWEVLEEGRCLVIALPVHRARA